MMRSLATLQSATCSLRSGTWNKESVINSFNLENMSYSETLTEEFFHFTEEEDEAIKKYFGEKGYRYSHNTVCGSCCGMYSDTYWVNGIGGEWKSEEDRAGLHELLKSMDCEHSIYSYNVDADPSGGEFFEGALTYKR